MTIATRTTIAIGLFVGGMTLGFGGTTKELAAQATDDSPGTSARWDFKVRSPQVVQIEHALQQIGEVNFTDIPLKDALNYIEEAFRIPLVVDTKSLSDEEKSIDQTVSLVSSAASVKSVLRLLLAENSLDYIIKDDLLIITTVATAEQHFEIRVYNTKRLPGISSKELAEIITGTIEPDKWNPVAQDTSVETTSALEPANVVGKKKSTASGGARAMSFSFGFGAGATATSGIGAGDAGHLGSARWTRNALVIRQTQRTHEKIVDLLEQLEQSEKYPSETVKPTNPVKR